MTKKAYSIIVVGCNYVHYHITSRSWEEGKEDRTEVGSPSPCYCCTELPSWLHFICEERGDMENYAFWLYTVTMSEHSGEIICIQSKI